MGTFGGCLFGRTGTLILPNQRLAEDSLSTHKNASLTPKVESR